MLFFDFYNEKHMDWLFSPLQHRINKLSKVVNIGRMTNINVSPVAIKTTSFPKIHLWLFYSY